MVYETEIKVRYVETDQMGIVHHSNYFPWLEVGRTELFNSIGISYGELEKNGLLLPLIDTYCKYVCSAKYEDEIIIQTKIEELKLVQIKLSYTLVRKNDKKILAMGYTTHVFANSYMKPVNLKKYRHELYDILANCI